MTFKHEKRIPPVVWTVVADRSRARFISATWPEIDGWKEVLSLDFEEGTLRGRDITTDGPGTFSGRVGGHHGGQEETDFQHQFAERFASELIVKLEAARSKNEFGKLAIVAPPLFLGVFRKKLPSPLQQMVVLEINKDYTSSTLDKVVEHVRPELAAKSAE